MSRSKASITSGILAGAAGLLVFLVIHHVWIKPIWFILPLGLVIAAIGGLAVGWAYSELLPYLPADPVFHGRESVKRGYRSALRVAVRVEGRLAGALVFFSFTPAAFKEADLLVARRIRDRLVLHVTEGRGAEAARRAAESTERTNRSAAAGSSVIIASE